MGLIPPLDELKARAARLLNRPAPNWMQNTLGRLPDSRVFTNALSRTPTLDVAKNIQNTPLRWAGQFAEGVVNTPSNIVRSYGRSMTDIRNGAPLKQTLGNVGELGLNMASFVPLGKGVQLAKQGVAQTVARNPMLKQTIIQGARSGAKMGGLFGAGYGVTGAMQQNASLSDILKQGAYGGAVGYVGGGILGGGIPAVSGGLKAISHDLAVRGGKSFGPVDSLPHRIVGTGKDLGFNERDLRGLPAQTFDPNAPLVPGTFRQIGEAMPRPGMSIQDVSRNPEFNPQLKPVAPEPKVDDFLKDKTIPPAQSSLQKARGFGESVKETPQISDPTKVQVGEMYTPKPNTQLMGEAKALLEDGASIDLSKMKDSDQKIAAAIQEAINLDSKGNPDAAANLLNNLNKMGTEYGRAVQAFSLLQKMSPQAIGLSLAGKIRKYNALHPNKPIPELNGEMYQRFGDMVKGISDMPEGREKNLAINDLQKEMNNVIPSTIADKVMATWKAGLLTSLRTTARNILGNTVNTASEMAKDVPATAADMLMGQKTGKRTVSITLRGTIAGAKEGFRASWDTMKHGFDPEESISKYDVKHITWGDNAVEQGLKKYTESIFRFLGAQDQPYYKSAFARSLYDQAGAAAINAGKRGDRKFIEDIVRNPSEEMKLAATQDASYATFRNTNKFGEVLAKAKSAIGDSGQAGKVVSELILPFVQVPIGIAGQILNYSPIGLARGVAKVGQVLMGKPEAQRVAAQVFGRGVVGTAIYGAATYLAQKGLISGYPKDPEEARQWELEGKTPRSIYINGKWRAIGSVGPQLIVALAAEAGHSSKSAGEFALTVGKDYLNQALLGGINRPLQALADPKRYGESYLQSQASSIIPNIVKDTASAFDSYKRERNSVGDAMLNSIPGARNTLLPTRDVFGNPVQNNMSGWRAFVDLFNSSTPIHTPAVDELSRLNMIEMGATPGKIRDTQELFGQKVKLSPEELDKLEQESGNALRPALDSLVSSKEYQQMNNEQKQQIIGDLVSEVRSKVKNGLATGESAFSGFDSASLTEKYQRKIAKQQFDESGKNFQEWNGRIFRRSADGVIQDYSKPRYEELLTEAKMKSAIAGEDINQWFTLAKKKYQLLNEQLADANVDDLDKVTIQNDLNALIKQAAKYKKYGGFTKPRAGRKGKKVTIKKSKTFREYLNQGKKKPGSTYRRVSFTPPTVGSFSGVRPPGL